MIAWLTLTVMLVIATLIAFTPLIRRFASGGPVALTRSDILREELAEIERDRAAGRIDANQADAAINILNQRLLAAEGDASAQPSLSTVQRPWVTAVVGTVVALGSVSLFLFAPAQSNQRTVFFPERASQTYEFQSPLGGAQISANKGGLPSVQEMMERLLKRLESNPKDMEGWRLLGLSYANLERYTDAADAIAKAIEINSSIPNLLSLRGEMLVRAARGTVTDEARQSFESALKLDPKDRKARLFLAVATAQRGDKTGALESVTNLFNEGNLEETESAEIRRLISEWSRELGVDADARLRTATSPDALFDQLKQASGEARSPQHPAPTGAVPRAFERDRETADTGDMIKAMVTGLERRLEQSPRDADGWIKLIRSWTVLGDKEAARRALARSMAVFEDAPRERDNILENARGMGLEP